MWKELKVKNVTLNWNQSVIALDVSPMIYQFFTLTGSRHGRSAGHADIRRVQRLLQDDVSETGPVPADDGVQ